MKAIILEVRDGYAAALREDGLVVKTKQLGEVGTTIELNETVVAFPTQGRRIARTAVAAALALAVTGGAYTYTNVAEASYVTLDTEETSVELAVNRMGRVVKVRALDEDSAELAKELSADIRRMKVEDAVDAAMTRMDSASTVVAGVTGENDKRSADLQDAVERGMERRERGDMELVTLEISRDERREAGEQDMSAGRWAFERGGGRWHAEDADERTEPDEPQPPEESDARDLDERPAFAPNGEQPTPPTDGETPPALPENRGQPPHGEIDDAREDDREDADDREPPEARDDFAEERTDMERPALPEGAMPEGQPPQDGAMPDNQPPQGSGPMAMAPQDARQPPQGNQQPPQGGMPGLGAMPPQR